MGLDTTHNCWHGAYSSFNLFRKNLASLIGFNLNDFEGFGGTRSFSEMKHGIMPLLNHSDCDGELTVDECKSIVEGLNDVLEKNKELEQSDKYFYYKVVQFRDGCLDAISNNEEVRFQ